MSPSRSLARALWRRVHPFHWPLILLVVYLLGELLFVMLAAEGGLFFPTVSGSGLTTLALGLLVLALRLIVYVLLPGVVVYKLVLLIWEGALRRGA